MSSPKITVLQEYPDGRLTKWTGTGEVEFCPGEPYSRLLVTAPDLRRVGLVSPLVSEWFDVDPARDGTPARWVERAEDGARDD